MLWHTKKCIFCQSDKKTGVVLIYSHRTTIVVLAVVIFLLDNLGEEVSAPDYLGTACFNNSCETPVRIAASVS